eukprot:5848954-Heterocapsa_arctica.AAC.1
MVKVLLKCLRRVWRQAGIWRRDVPSGVRVAEEQRWLAAARLGTLAARSAIRRGVRRLRVRRARPSRSAT